MDAQPRAFDFQTPTRAVSSQAYELWGEIASGGMASVHLGRARGAAGFERWVAIKRCHPHLAKTPAFREMLLEEARLVALIQHPNVVGTLDVVDGESLCVVMDYVEGGSWDELTRAATRRGQRLPLACVLRLAMDALAGLHAAHELRNARGESLQLVHRDVSPQNILVSTAGVARLADFGIAKASSRASHTEVGQVRGKLGYVAPELLAGTPCTRRVDVYAMGVLLWEALAGERLFQGESEGAVIQRILENVIASLVPRIPEVTPELDAVLRRATFADPMQRYATAAQMAEALEGLGLPISSALEMSLVVKELLAPQLLTRQALIRTALAGMEPTTSDPLPRPELVTGTLTLQKSSGAGRPSHASALPPAVTPPRRSHPLAIALGVGVGLAAAAGLFFEFRPQRATRLETVPTHVLPQAASAPAAPVLEAQEEPVPSVSKERVKPVRRKMTFPKVKSKPARRGPLRSARAPGVAPSSTPAAPSPAPHAQPLSSEFEPDSV